MVGNEGLLSRNKRSEGVSLILSGWREKHNEHFVDLDLVLQDLSSRKKYRRRVFSRCKKSAWFKSWSSHQSRARPAGIIHGYWEVQNEDWLLGTDNLFWRTWKCSVWRSAISWYCEKEDEMKHQLLRWSGGSWKTTLYAVIVWKRLKWGQNYRLILVNQRDGVHRRCPRVKAWWFASGDEGSWRLRFKQYRRLE